MKKAKFCISGFKLHSIIWQALRHKFPACRRIKECTGCTCRHFHFSMCFVLFVWLRACRLVRFSFCDWSVSVRFPVLAALFLGGGFTTLVISNDIIRPLYLSKNFHEMRNTLVAFALSITEYSKTCLEPWCTFHKFEVSFSTNGEFAVSKPRTNRWKRITSQVLLRFRIASLKERKWKIVG